MNADFKEMTMNKLSTASIREFCQLVLLNLKVRVKDTAEYASIVWKYYDNLCFLKSDLSLTLMYLFHNPYRISKRFLITRGDENLDVYGETPLTTLELILRQSGVTSPDHLVELGSGRGRGCFWAHAFIGCKVTGIEFISEFVDRANMIASKLDLSGITFKNEEMTQADFSEGTVFYLYGSALDDETIDALVAKFEKMPSGTKILTVSFPLSDYTESNAFELMKCFPAEYPWGTADVYLQVKK